MNNANVINDNPAFVEVRGQFRLADDPNAVNGGLPVDQLLGVNDKDVAVGFYTDAQGNNHGYEYNVRLSTYSPVVDPSSPSASLTAAAINDDGQTAGLHTNPINGVTDDGHLVGFYTDAAANADGLLATPVTSSTARCRAGRVTRQSSCCAARLSRNPGYAPVNDHSRREGARVAGYLEPKQVR
jgi:S-formylglutathione hydrolase FrmB